MDILILLADLALTVFVYCSPAAVYRFLIKKEPAEKKLARNFCIISSVIVYLLLLVIYLSAGFDMVPNVAAAAIWGFVSYRILLYEDKAKAKTMPSLLDEIETAPVQLSIFDLPENQLTNYKSLEEEEEENGKENKGSTPLCSEQPIVLDSTREVSRDNKKIDTATLTVVAVLVLLVIFALACFVYAISIAVSIQ